MHDIIQALSGYFHEDNIQNDSLYEFYYKSRREDWQLAVEACHAHWSKYCQLNTASDGALSNTLTGVVNKLMLDSDPEIMLPNSHLCSSWRCICVAALFISMLDAQVDTNTQVQVYRTPIADGVFPDISTFINEQHGPTSLIYAEHHNNNKCLALIETAAKLPNFWHVVPAGTYKFGFSEEVFVVSHQLEHGDTFTFYQYYCDKVGTVS